MADSNQVKRKRGRPRRVFTPDQIADIERLAKLNMHTETIADALGIPMMDIVRHFGKILTKKRAEGKAEIAQAQQSMVKTIPVMAIWLGKQHLGQSDTQKVEISGLPAVVVQLQGAPEGGK